MQNDKRQIAENAPIKGGKRVVSGAVLIVCIIVLAIGSVVARYATEKIYSSEMQSASFHISSDYLVGEGEGQDPDPYVVPHSGAFDICLYNYEKENVAQISQVDITYKVTVQNATVAVKDDEGIDVVADEGNYQLKKSTGEDGKAQPKTQILHVMPNTPTSPDSPITVTVQTTSPYAKTLTAQFTVASSMPSYTITDQSDGTVLVTIETNDYAGDVKLNWKSDKYSPDNTNALMESWTDASARGEFAAEPNSTYKLLFFKNTTAPYNEGNEKTGTGKEITLE